MALGLEGGLVWAFLGGLVIDVLLMRPLGLTAFIDLLAVGAAWVIGRLAPRALVSGDRGDRVRDGRRRCPAGRRPVPGAARRAARRRSADRCRSSPRSSRPSSPRSSRRRPSRWLVPAAPPRRSGWTGERPRAAAQPPAPPGSVRRLRARGRRRAQRPHAPPVVPAAGRASTRAQRRPPPSATAASRARADPVDAWAHPRPGGTPPRRERADLHGPGAPGRPAALAAHRGRRAARRAPRHDAGGDQHDASTPATLSRFDAIAIAREVPEATARLISEDGLTLPGVEVTVEPRRDYLAGTLMTQIVGYTGALSAEGYTELKDAGYLPDDRIGKAGVELVYEDELRGIYGTQRVEKDGTGRTIRVVGIETPPVAGSSLVLTIDTKEQKLAEKALMWGLNKAGLKRGAMVVLNPQTGEVLAMVRYPSYDANLFSRGITDAQFKKLLTNPHKPLINHAIGDIQPPGSTYKLVTATGGLADKIITTTSTLLSKPYVQLGATKFWEWNRQGWGPLERLRRLRALERHLLLPAGRPARHHAARLLGAPARVRAPDRHRPSQRGGRPRADEPVEDGHLRPADLPGRGPAGRHRAGLRPRDGAPGRQRVRRDRQRRHAVPAPGRARDPGPGRHGCPAASSRR